jgi:hypothetical protein
MIHSLSLSIDPMKVLQVSDHPNPKAIAALLVPDACQRLS